MKVLYFHQHFSTPSGASGIRSYEMALRLIARGHQVTMVCGSYSGGETGLTEPFSKGVRRGIVNGIEIIEFDLSYSYNLADSLNLTATYAYISFDEEMSLRMNRYAEDLDVLRFVARYNF